MLGPGARDIATPFDGTSSRDGPSHGGHRRVDLDSCSLRMCKYKG